jgi:hypothetical protein
MSFNEECNMMYVCSGKYIMSCPCKEVSNKHVSKGELFFKVPVGDTANINLINIASEA